MAGDVGRGARHDVRGSHGGATRYAENGPVALIVVISSSSSSRRGARAARAIRNQRDYARVERPFPRAKCTVMAPRS